MSRTIFYLLFIPAIYLTGCESKQDNVLLSLATVDKNVKDLLSKALEKAGGISDWQSLAKIKFDKVTKLYDENGILERRTDQHHRYHLKPKKILEIIWQDSTGNHQLMLRNDQVEKYINGKVSTFLDSVAARENLLAAEYAALLPFKLLDPGMVLSYQGLDSVAGVIVHVLQARMQEENNNERDIWWHYFNSESFLHTGYRVKHEDHISLVLNDDFVTVDQFMLPGRRTSYRVDESDNILYKRADYQYDNYSLRRLKPRND